MHTAVNASTMKIVKILAITVFVAISITIIWEFLLEGLVGSFLGWEPKPLEAQYRYTMTILTFILLSLIVPAFLLIRVDRQRSKTEWLLQQSHDEISMEVKKRTKELEVANSALGNKIIEIRKTQQLLAKSEQRFMEKLVERQEEERRRIGSEIHDSLGQNLLFVRNAIEEYIGSSKEKEEQLGNVLKSVSETIEETRRISGKLHPHILSRLGLSKAIVNIIETSSNASPINFDIHIQDLKNIFSSEEEINIFRIVQESLSNMLKHSEATSVEIIAIMEEGFLALSLSDNGKGMPNGSYAGFGINSIKNRVKLLGGTFRIDSVAGKGTTLSIKIPKIPQGVNAG